MRKKWTLTAFSMSAICLSVMTWYVFADQRITVKANSSRAWVIPYSNVQELMNAAPVDVIIQATVTPKSQPQTIKMDARIGIEYRRMFTEVNVEKLFKSDNRAASKQKTITIVEPTYITDNGLVPGKTEYPFEDYRKAEAGKKYIFFLSWSEQAQAYWVYASHQGKYNIDGNDTREKELEARNENYRRLKDGVINKFK